MLSTKESSSKQAFNINQLESLFDLTDLSNEVQTHLCAVYRLLSAIIIISVIGSWVQIRHSLLSQFVWPYILLLVLCLVLISCIPRNTKTQFLIRVALSMLFGFIQGIIIGPLINQAIAIDPMIVRMALLLTSCVFVSFSIIAMITKNKKILYLGSLLNSFCFFMILMNIMPSQFGYNLSLYGGLILFTGYVFYDTQMIIKRVEKFGLKNTDCVSDAIQLYIDFVAIFIRLLILIMKSKQRNNSNNNGPSVASRSVKIDL